MNIQLREYTEQDIPLAMEYLNNPNVTRWLSSRIPQPYTLKDATWWINEGSRQGINRVIEVDGLFVGAIGATPGMFEFSKSAEVGYWLSEAHWGKGIVTQALRQFTTGLESSEKFIRLYSHVFEGNNASMRVLEKCGYEQEAVLRKGAFKHGKALDVYVFAKLIHTSSKQ